MPLVLLLSCALWPDTARSAALAAPPDPVCFQVWREGSRIGQHRIAFRRDDSGLQAMIAIDLEIAFGPIRLFHYRHRSRELWRDGRLRAIETRTDDDGASYAVSGRASASGFLVDGGEGRSTLPGDVVPTSYWREDLLQRQSWFDSQNGRSLAVTVGSTTALPGTAVSYAIAGDLELTAGYDRQGRWRGLRFTVRGNRIDYRPCTTAEAAAGWRFALDAVPLASGRRASRGD